MRHIKKMRVAGKKEIDDQFENVRLERCLYCNELLCDECWWYAPIGMCLHCKNEMGVEGVHSGRKRRKR
jgi:hypothetical protein